MNRHYNFQARAGHEQVRCPLQVRKQFYPVYVQMKRFLWLLLKITSQRERFEEGVLDAWRGFCISMMYT